MVFIVAVVGLGSKKCSNHKNMENCKIAILISITDNAIKYIISFFKEKIDNNTYQTKKKNMAVPEAEFV